MVNPSGVTTTNKTDQIFWYPLRQMVPPLVFAHHTGKLYQVDVKVKCSMMKLSNQPADRFSWQD